MVCAHRSLLTTYIYLPPNFLSIATRAEQVFGMLCWFRARGLEYISPRGQGESNFLLSNVNDIAYAQIFDVFATTHRLMARTAGFAPGIPVMYNIYGVDTQTYYFSFNKKDYKDNY
jgi:hypothetical protein